MNKHVQQEIDNLLISSALFTKDHQSSLMLCSLIAMKCRDEAYKSSSLESGRIDHWEDVTDELTKMIEEI